jgi:4-amino-4-deoxy-L-arabinose transferase-like glycosyltransferase
MTQPRVSNPKAQSDHPPSATSLRRVWIPLAIILCLAAALRLYRLDSVPPGLTHDEANYIPDAVSILRGARPLYFPVPQGKEALYLYSVALMMTFVSPPPLALRLTSALWGILLVALIYTWARRAFDRSTALWTTAGLALSFWGVSTSRMGLRAITLPALFTAALLVSRLAEKKPPAFIGSAGAGLLLGLTFYTYLAARVMPAIPLLFGLYLFLTSRDRWRQHWPGWICMLIVATVVAAPLFLYLRAYPAAEIRVGQLDQPLRDLMSGNPAPLLKNVFQTLGVLSFRGDGFIPYNIPGRPILDPLMSLLFYAGLGIALWRWRDPPHALALLWLAVGFFPALATGVEAAHLRAINAQPVLFLFPALTLERLRSVRAPRLRVLKRVSYLVGALALTLLACLTARDYFARWANDRDVRVHYHTNLMAIIDTLPKWEQDEPIVISTFYPGEYHDPRILEAVLGESAPPVRWLDGRQAVLLPPAPTARLILPAAIPLDETLWAFVEPDVALREQVLLRPDDFDPGFQVYQWSVDRTLSTLQAAMMIPSQPPQLPLKIGEWLTFQGHQLAGWTGKPGSEFDLLTLWQVEARLPDDRDAVLFTQLLDSHNQVAAQQDQLGAPSWSWQPGDVILQLHRLSLPAGASPGQYTLIAGVYTVPDRVDAILAGHEPDPGMPRLPVLVDGAAVGDHILLQSVEVVTQ